MNFEFILSNKLQFKVCHVSSIIQSEKILYKYLFPIGRYQLKIIAVKLFMSVEIFRTFAINNGCFKTV